MSDKDFFRPAGEIGAGTQKLRKGPLFPRSIGVSRRRNRPSQGLPINNKAPRPVPGSELGDIPNRNLEVGTRAHEGKRGAQKDIEYDRPLTVAPSKIHSPDAWSYSFDRQETGTNNAGVDIAANTNNQVLLSVQISQGIRGVLKRFAWRTNAAGSSQLTFGLYVGEELVAPGGRFLGDQPRTTNEYEPSGGQIADLSICAECHIPIDPDTTVQILVSNPTINTYPAWARLWGWHWEEETREAGERAFYNIKHDKVMG